MNNIYFSSDFHFNHKNIVRGTSNWSDKSKCRNFNTLEEHDQTLIDNINKTVKENDILYFLGDFAFNGINNIWNFRKQLNVRTIHFIMGNHDIHIENNRVLPNCIYDTAKTRGLIIDGDIKTQKEDDYSFNEYTTNEVHAREIFASVKHYREITINGQRIIMSHYAMRVWNKSHHGSWMLFGHSHGSMPDYKAEDGSLYRTMDVGVDTHPEFRPYSFDELKQIMSNRIPLAVDHHNSQTT